MVEEAKKKLRVHAFVSFLRVYFEENSHFEKEKKESATVREFSCQRYIFLRQNFV